MLLPLGTRWKHSGRSTASGRGMSLAAHLDGRTNIIIKVTIHVVLCHFLLLACAIFNDQLVLKTTLFICSIPNNNFNKSLSSFFGSGNRFAIAYISCLGINEIKHRLIKRSFTHY